jgi:hypothetical protein
VLVVRPFLLLLSFILVAAAQTPDRIPLADEWGYRPADAGTVAVNPPAFSWVHEKGARSYTVEWADNAAFSKAASVNDVPWSVYTHNASLKPGKWFWRYRIVAPDGRESPWSKSRSFIIPKHAPVHPQPTIAELRGRIPRSHPRLFLRSEDIPELKRWAESGGKQTWQNLIRRADQLATAEPTPEPNIRGSLRDPATRDHWWSNRVQALKALGEAEILSFAWLITKDPKYAAPAKRFTLALAKWDPDGPTNFALNCEAGKPMLHRLARAYDWAYPLFSDDERAFIRAVLLRRANDAWKSGEVREGAGHLNQPYNSHGNRTWHKLAENALATFGETQESDKFLHYAVTKFFAAYPAWADEDGGWHEGLSYLAGYMVKTTWWMDIASNTLGIDPFRNPFFARIGDYAMYSAPPGSPDMGFGDLSFRPPSGGWSFLRYFANRAKNPYWTWWLDSWQVPEESGEPVLAFLWSRTGRVTPKPPSDLASSRAFHSTGVAVLNSNLLDGAKNVQVRFKSSPMGRWSHGHDAHNSFTLNAYGIPLLVNNVYRDRYGSPFHTDWVWEARAQNAVLIDGKGQKKHSADLGGRILKLETSAALDYVAGDATASYEGRLKRARRHIFFIKPDVVVIADDLEAPASADFQFMLHGQREFMVDQSRQRLVLDRGKAGVVVDYAPPQPATFKQWTGYTPEPDHAYLASVRNPSIPDQWHVEASTAAPSGRALVFTVLRIFGDGKPAPSADVRRVGAGVQAADVSLAIEGATATVRRGGREWKVSLPE